VEDIDEPPSCTSNPSCTFQRHIGRTAGQLGCPGKQRTIRGLFVSRAQALKYALFENGITRKPSFLRPTSSNSTCIASAVTARGQGCRSSLQSRPPRAFSVPMESERALVFCFDAFSSPNRCPLRSKRSNARTPPDQPSSLMSRHP